MLIKLTKGEITLVFDPPLNNNGGFVSGIKMVPVLNPVANNSIGSRIIIKTMPVDIDKR
jgi:hypothetical protein